MRVTVKRFSELIPDWPPRVVEGRRNVTYPIKWDQALLNGPISLDKEFVRFYSSYEGQLLLCSFQTPNKKTSAKVVSILERNQGRTVHSLENIEVPEE
jgi:hypothetical protein